MLTISKSVGLKGQNISNDVTHVQMLINANIGRLTPLAPLVEDGKSGKMTVGAIEEFQTRIQKIKPTGRVDPGSTTLSALSAAVNKSSPPNRTAQFENKRFAGKRNQMTTGRITVNNHCYFFTCGGHGRGSIPVGSYTVTKHREERSGKPYSHDGVGYSFAMSDKYDPRVKGPDRSLLRIHPDGRSAGTNGCIGILGGAATQRAFRSDMNAEIDRTSTKSIILNVKSVV